MKGRKILIAVPCLIPSGGINVLLELIKVLQELGYQVGMLSRERGYLYEAFAELGVSIKVKKDVMEESLASWIVENYDEVLVNTLQMCGLIYRLNGREIEVKWWIHEPPLFFDKIGEAVPQEFWDMLLGNIKILAAGNIVHEYILQTFGKENEILNFGIEDVASQIADDNIDIVSSDKITFLLPSIIVQPVKGQDIFALAIAGLPPEYNSRAEFIFVGNKTEGMEEYYDVVKSLEWEKENVKMFDIIDREEMLMLMRQVDCIVAPSREDATNACIVEGLMLSKLCICSDSTGVSRYMEDCVNGFVFPVCNVAELRARIMLVIDNIERLDIIKQNGRKVYEKEFSLEIFKKNVRKYW